MQVFLRAVYLMMHKLNSNSTSVTTLRALSLENELNTVRSELFQALLAELISSDRACRVSQRYLAVKISVGKFFAIATGCCKRLLLAESESDL